jgi:rod shape-determining protein MreD
LSLPVAAVGALIAALLETSVLTELTIAGVKPDLVLVITVVVAIVVGFEDALVWAVVGGFLVDAMSAQPLGATTLALLVMTGAAALAGRLTGSPRLITVALSVFILGCLYQMVLYAILAVTAGIGVVDLPADRIFLIGLLDLVIGIVVIVVVRAIDRRFGPAERPEW